MIYAYTVMYRKNPILSSENQAFLLWSESDDSSNIAIPTDIQSL